MPQPGSADLTYTASLDSSGIIKGLSEIQRGIEAGHATVKRWAIGLAAMGGVTLSVRGIWRQFKDTLEEGSALKNLSMRTGESVDKLRMLEQAFKDTGLGAGMVGPMINRMQMMLSQTERFGGRAATALDQLGLSIDGIRKMSPAEQLEAISKGMQKIGDPMIRRQIAGSLFGNLQGGRMLQLFEKGVFEDAAKVVGNQAGLLKRNAKMFDEASNILNATGVKVRGFFVGVADKIVPVLMPLLKEFKYLDLSKYGQMMGEEIAIALEALQEGQLGEYLKAAFEYAIVYFRVKLVGAIQYAAQMLTATFIAAFKGAAAIIDQGVSNWIVMLRESRGLSKAANLREKAQDVTSKASAQDLGSMGWWDKIGGSGKNIASHGGFLKFLEQQSSKRGDIAGMLKMGDIGLPGHPEQMAIGLKGNLTEEQVSKLRRLAEIYIHEIANGVQKDATEMREGFVDQLQKATDAKIKEAADKFRSEYERAGIDKKLTEGELMQQYGKTLEEKGAAFGRLHDKFKAAAAKKAAAQRGEVPKVPAFDYEGMGGPASRGGTDSDRLAKIGLFVGGAGPVPAVLSKIEQHTKDTAKQVEALNGRLATTSALPVGGAARYA